MRILVLPAEFGDVLHLQAPVAVRQPQPRTSRESGRLVVRLDVPEFSDDDLSVAVTRERLTILGSGSAGSFYVHVLLPPDARFTEVSAELREGQLEVSLPLESSAT